MYHINDWIDAETELIPRLGKLPEVVKAITLLYIDQPITNAVLDKNAYFVACLTEKEAARKAKYSEVKEKVHKNFSNEKALELAKTAAKTTSVKITSALKSKKSLPADIKFKDFPVFTPSNPTPIIKEENGYAVFQEAIQTKEKTVSQAIDTSNGAIIIYVEKITLPSKSEFEKEKVTNLTNYKKAVQQVAWNNFLLMLEQNSNTLIKTSVKNRNSR